MTNFFSHFYTFPLGGKSALSVHQPCTFSVWFDGRKYGLYCITTTKYFEWKKISEFIALSYVNYSNGEGVVHIDFVHSKGRNVVFAFSPAM